MSAVLIVSANVFIHREPVDDCALESGVDDEVSNDERGIAPPTPKVVYKIGLYAAANYVLSVCQVLDEPTFVGLL